MKLIIALVLIFLTDPLLAVEISKFSRFPFLPSVIKSNEDRLCRTIIDIYTERFKSEVNTSIITADGMDREASEAFSRNQVDWLQWTPVDVEESRGSFSSTTISLESGEHSLLLYRRPGSWRGDYFEMYHVDKDINSLIAQLRKTPRNKVTPIHESFNIFQKPFIFDNSLYAIGEHWEFAANDGKRNVYRVAIEDENEIVCELSIYPDKDIFRVSELSAYAALRDNIANIYGKGSAACEGTLNSHQRGRFFGQMNTSSVVFRPWTKIGSPSRKYAIDMVRVDQFLADWAHQDIWSLREFQTLKNHFKPAYFELSEYYVDAFGLSTTMAESLARTNIEASLEAFMIIPSSFEEFRNTVEQKKLRTISTGKTFDWSHVRKKFEKVKNANVWDAPYDYNEYASLVIDSPRGIADFRSTYPYDKAINAFTKTMLMYAAHMNNYDAVVSLIDHETDIDRGTAKNPNAGRCPEIPSRLGRTALHYAAENASVEILDLLIQHGADINAVDSKGNGIDFYLQKNPRLSDDEKNLGIALLVRHYQQSNAYFRPSFDCAKARTRTEKMICASKSLAIYDGELGKAYKKLRAKSRWPSFERDDQRTWLKQRDKLCQGIDEDIEFSVCLIQQTRARSRYMHSRISKISPIDLKP